MKVTSLDDSLTAALLRMDIQLPIGQVSQLEDYCAQLWSWNERMNLTRHTDFTTFAQRDVLDSVRLGKCLAQGETVLDIGSGGGVPGVILCIMRPDLKVTLSDSVLKKAAALNEIAKALELNCRVHAGRAEQLLSTRRFDAVVARAVGRMSRILTWLEPHWGSIGRVLLLKGPRWVDERKEARHLGLLRNLDLRRLEHYPMPGTQADGVILSLSQRAIE